MKRSTLAWGLGVLGLMGVLLVVTLVAVTFGSAALPGRPFAEGFPLGSRVGIVDLEGLIVSADYVRDTLKRFRETPTVKAVVLRINSPGGGVAASQELNREILRFRSETKKPVVVSMESVAASGGYYAAVAADWIVANPGSITGSIGVIVQWVNYGELFDWAKLRTVTFKTGALKDAGNPARPLTDEEKKFFDDLVHTLLGQFQEAVREGRKGRLKPGALETMADGRVVTGAEARELGLVDELGDLGDATSRAARLAGLSLPAETWHPRRTRPGLLELLLGPSESSWAGRLIAGAPVGGGWNAYFLW